MGSWMEVLRCKECGKIFKNNTIPNLCPKCGIRLGTSDLFTRLVWGPNKIIRDPNNCEKVVARRRLFGWQIQQPEQKATQDERVTARDPQQNTEDIVST